MVPVTPEHYLNAVKTESISKDAYKKSERRALLSGALGIVAAVLCVNSEKLGFSREAIVGLAGAQLGSTLLLFQSGLAMTYHESKFRSAQADIEAYESAAMTSIATSEQGRELSFITDVIDPPTED
jgi:hypothetical protein